MKKQKLINNRGFTTGEIIIAIILIVMFVSIITTSFYNYYMSVQSKTRRTIATNAVIDTIENVEIMKYEDINEASVNDLVQNLMQDGTIPSEYNLTATIQKYNETENNENKLDLIKILNVKIQYMVSNKEETFEITRLITK